MTKIILKIKQIIQKKAFYFHVNLFT